MEIEVRQMEMYQQQPPNGIVILETCIVYVITGLITINNYQKENPKTKKLLHHY